MFERQGLAQDVGLCHKERRQVRTGARLVVLGLHPRTGRLQELRSLMVK
jgi:hypothetical protein